MITNYWYVSFSDLTKELELITFGRRDRKLKDVTIHSKTVVSTDSQGEWLIAAGSYITNVHLIAMANGIKQVSKFIDNYEEETKIKTKPHEWKKLKGDAEISQNGITCTAEVHFYMVGTDPIWFKVDHFFDFWKARVLKNSHKHANHKNSHRKQRG